MVRTSVSAAQPRHRAPPLPPVLLLLLLHCGLGSGLGLDGAAYGRRLQEQEGVCALTGMTPREPRYLKFCQDYNEEACCIPGHDLENQVQFENLIDGLGPGCKNPMMYPAIRYFYCLGYTRDKGDGSDTQVISICQDFVEQALWHNETRRQYEECGVMKYNECPESMSDFDPYQCGDDLVIPTIFWSSATEFMNYMSPPGLYDFEFEVVPDADAVDESGEPTCWKPVSMRTRRASASASRRRAEEAVASAYWSPCA